MKKIAYYKNSSHHQWMALVGLSLGFSLTFLDSGALNIALPFIQNQFNSSTSEIFWVVNAYVMAIATTALAAGRLGDLYGLRFTFLIGILLFMISSIACASAQSTLFLILSRIFQGFAGAITLSVSTTIIYHIFPAKTLGKAIGVFGLASVFFNATGPILGGFFTQYLSWRWIFWLNPFVGTLSFFMTFHFLRGLDRERDHRSSFDVLGQVFLMLFLALFVAILMRAQTWGSTNMRTVLLFALSLFFLFFFVFIEKRQKHPLLNLQLFKKRNFKIGLLTFFSVQFSLTAPVLYAFYLIHSLKLTPAQAGLALLPPSVLSFISNPLAGKLIDRFGQKHMIIVGTLLGIFAFLWLSFTAPHYNYLFFMFGLALTIFAAPIIFISTYIMVMRTACDHQKGMVSGTTVTFRQTGGAISVALISAIIAFIENRFEKILTIQEIYMKALQVATLLIACMLFIAFIFSFSIEKFDSKKVY